MKAVDPGPEYGVSRTYGANQPEYRPLPTRAEMDSQGTVLTKWELTPEECEALAAGAKLGLRLLTFDEPLQPIYLFVEGTEGDPYRPQPSGTMAAPPIHEANGWPDCGCGVEFEQEGEDGHV